MVGFCGLPERPRESNVEAQTQVRTRNFMLARNHPDHPLDTSVNALTSGPDGSGTPEEVAEALAEQANRCRRLANSMYDREASRLLSNMADGFDKSANELTQNRR